MDAKKAQRQSAGGAAEGPAMIVAALEGVLRRIPGEVLHAARRSAVGGSPRMLVEDRQAAWHFTVCDDSETEYFVEVRIEARAIAQQQRLGFEVRCRCECAYFQDIGTCSHVHTALTWLRGDVVSPHPSRKEQLDRFLETCTGSSGNWYIGKLVQAVQSAEERRTQAETRLQWRIGVDAVSAEGQPPRYRLRVYAYEQKRLRRGGTWSPGRQIDWNSAAFLSLCENDPRDLRIASLLRSGGARGDAEVAVWEALPAMVDHPNCVWATRDLHAIELHSRKLRIDCVDRTEIATAKDSNTGKEPTTGKGYEVRLSLGGRKFFPTISQSQQVIVCGQEGAPYRVVVAEPQKHRLLFSQRLGKDIAEWIAGLLALQLEMLVIDDKTARQLLEVAGPLGRIIDLELPESLSGPRVPIPVAVALMLEPAEHGLRARIRLVDSHLIHPLVPGAGQQEITVATTLGPQRWVRDLEQEESRARDIEQRLQLSARGRAMERESWGWRIDSFDDAVDLLNMITDWEEGAPAVLWPEGKRMRMLGELTPSALRVRVEDRHDWFGIKGVLRLDGEEIALDTVLKAIRSGGRYVRVGENAFAKISDAFRSRLSELGDTLQIDRQGAKIARVAAPLLQELLGDECLLEESAEWRRTLQKLEEVQKLEPELPSTLKADLREYQKEGYRWLARLSAWGAGAILADDMGLGKTVQALGVMLDRADAGPTLVVAPTSVGENWMRETARFAPSLRPFLYRDHDREALVEKASARDVVITSYALLQRDVRRFTSRQWQTLVLDEAQFIKNAATKTARATRELQADWRLALSGTPLENHLGELWSLMRTISPGLLGTWDHFRVRFADPIEREDDAERRQALSRLVQPFILRRTKDKVLAELPARTEINRFAELSEVERQRYEAARMAAIQQLSSNTKDEEQQRFVVLSWLTRLRQLACHPRLVDAQWRGSSAKLDLLLETVDQLRDGEHRALVFSQFVQHLTLVREALDERGIVYQYLDGSTPAAERQRRVDAFQRGEGDLFLISLKAGGTGLNLTAADYVIHLDPWWNPAVEDQATDRAHRIGQQRPVTVLRLIAEQTIEEMILSLHADKRELVASVLDGTDRAGRMSTAEMISLIRGN